MAQVQKNATAAPASIDTPAARALRSFLAAHKGRSVFLEHEVKSLLADAGLPVPRNRYLDKAAASEPERLASHDLSYPLVAKVVSSAIAHKTDVGGVVVGLHSIDELKEASERLLAIDGAEGILVEEMAQKGTEVIVGGIIDPQFGPVVMFGLGGVFVEVFGDVVFGLAPLSAEEAFALIRRTSASRLLRGYRGQGPADTASLCGIITAVSEMMATGLISEIDLNPVAVYPEGVVVLDARMKASAG